MKKYRIFLFPFVYLLFTGCQNNNELNSESLKINVTLNTPIDIENQNIDWMASLFKSFTLNNNINYVSKNSNGEIGININRADIKKINCLNLEMHEGNGLRYSMGVYDNSNLVVDLEKLNIKSIITNSKLNQYISSVPINLNNDNTKKYDGIIDINQPLTEKEITRIIKNKLTNQKSNCTVNFLVVSNKKISVQTPPPPPPPDRPGNKVGEDNQPLTQLPPVIKNQDRIVKIKNLRYDPQSYSFKWNFTDEVGNILSEIPEHISVHAHVNQNTNDERSFLLLNGRTEIEMDVNSEDMEKIKNHCDRLAKITIRLILSDTKLKTTNYYDIPGEYRITCFTKSYCGFLLNNNKKW